MRRAAALAAALALGGCGTLDKLNERFAAPSTPAPVSASVAAVPASEMGRVKAALRILSTPNGDEIEALALVEPVARSGSDPDARQMAGFLQVLAGERRRLKESAAGAQARLRDERKIAEAQKQRADALQVQAAELQQKLDALAELEKSLSAKQVPNR